MALHEVGAICCAANLRFVFALHMSTVIAVIMWQPGGSALHTYLERGCKHHACVHNYDNFLIRSITSFFYSELYHTKRGVYYVSMSQ